LDNNGIRSKVRSWMLLYAGIAFTMQPYYLCKSNLEFIRVRALDMLSVDSYITLEIAEVNDEKGLFEGFLWNITLLKSLRKAPS